MKNAVIVIPTYNERNNIEMLIQNITNVSSKISNWNIEMLIIDSNSPDGTSEVVAQIQKNNKKVHLIKTPKEGLGKAYITGFSYAIEKLNPFILFEMDADLSHGAGDIQKFLKAIELGADFVIGSRYIRGGSIPANWGIHRKIFSIGANLFARIGFMKLSITDWTNGFRAIKTWVIKKSLKHVQHYSGYVFQVALLDSAIHSNAHIKDVPVHFVDRTDGVSKINSKQYIVQFFLYVLTHSSFIKFVMVGLFGFFVDFSFAYLFINTFRLPKVSSNMLSAEVAIVCNFLLNNFWSFRHKKIEGGVFAYVKTFVMFNTISLGSILIQGGGLTILLSLLGDGQIVLISGVSISSWIIYKVLIITFVIIPYSYLLYNKVIWKKK